MPQFDVRVKIVKMHLFDYTVTADTEQAAKDIIYELQDRGYLYDDRNMRANSMMLPPDVEVCRCQPDNPYEDGYFDIESIYQIEEEEDN